MVLFQGKFEQSFGTDVVVSQPRLANANYPPAGAEAATTSDLGLQLLHRIAGL